MSGFIWVFCWPQRISWDVFLPLLFSELVWDFLPSFLPFYFLNIWSTSETLWPWTFLYGEVFDIQIWLWQIIGYYKFMYLFSILVSFVFQRISLLQVVKYNGIKMFIIFLFMSRIWSDISSFIHHLSYWQSNSLSLAKSLSIFFIFSRTNFSFPLCLYLFYFIDSCCL